MYRNSLKLFMIKKLILPLLRDSVLKGLIMTILFFIGNWIFSFENEPFTISNALIYWAMYSIGWFIADLGFHLFKMWR